MVKEGAMKNCHQNIKGSGNVIDTFLVLLEKGLLVFGSEIEILHQKDI